MKYSTEFSCCTWAKHLAWSESIGGSQSGGSPNGGKIESAKSAETVSKVGSSSGAPPGELGTNIAFW